MPALIAAAAVILSIFAGVPAVLAKGADTAMTTYSERLSSRSSPTVAAFGTGAGPWVSFQHFQQWVGESYKRAPALILGLAALLAIPPLALAGLFFRRQRRSPDATLVISHPSQRSRGKPRATTARTEVSSWPTEAWVDIEGMPGGRFVIGRSLVRIGRESDNDIRLSAKTIHRYHAVIRRTTDGEVVITDLSSAQGNGVLINGTRVEEARLKKGDVINVGEVRLKFSSRPV
jgi:hypothetical protein